MFSATFRLPRGFATPSARLSLGTDGFCARAWGTALVSDATAADALFLCVRGRALSLSLSLSLSRQIVGVLAAAPHDSFATLNELERCSRGSGCMCVRVRLETALS